MSLAPFSYLISKYGDDLAILWIDSHPDMGTGETGYLGYHAMVVSALTGHGDQEVLDLLPATIPADRVALVGMHDWIDPTLPAVADEWGLTVFDPNGLRSDSAREHECRWPGQRGTQVDDSELAQWWRCAVLRCCATPMPKKLVLDDL